jgi:UDP-N-acetylmuramoyl-L-alanyl-D-glutamate--2,6-diaminopimelate ligase
MKLRSLLEALPVLEIIGTQDPEISSLVYDSRNSTAGALFFALPGSTKDGADFAHLAVLNGAVAVVAKRFIKDLPASIPQVLVENPRAFMALAASKFYGHPSGKLKVVGITGTNGKTTTSFLTRHILTEAGKSCGLVGTVVYAVGIEETPATRTTPESPDLQNLLAEMLVAGNKAVAMEVSSHALVLNRVDAIDFDVAVFSNLSQDHLDFHGDMESYFRAKALLFEKLKLSPKSPRRAVINIDDRFGHRLVDMYRKDLPVITYGLGAQANFRASNIRFEPNGTNFCLQAKGREYLVRLPLIGLFNVYNALAAIASASALGVEIRQAVAALARAPQIPGRLQRVQAKRNFQVFVDYAHTPDALENVLRTLKELIPNRIITVFGCGGDRDRAKRPLMAAAAEKFSDLVIATTDNPRTEKPEAILSDIRAGFSRRGYEIIPDREAAIFRAVDLAEAGDIVLIAGKGHETYQEINGRKIPFDDALIASRAIAAKRVFINE